MCVCAYVHSHNLGAGGGGVEMAPGGELDFSRLGITVKHGTLNPKPIAQRP